MSTTPYHATPEDIANAEPGDWLVAMNGQPIAQRIDAGGRIERWRTISEPTMTVQRVSDQRVVELAIIRNAVVLDLEHVRRALASMVEPATATASEPTEAMAGAAPDVELEALRTIVGTLGRLDPEQRSRAIRWAFDRYEA